MPPKPIIQTTSLPDSEPTKKKIFNQINANQPKPILTNVDSQDKSKMEVRQIPTSVGGLAVQPTPKPSSHLNDVPKSFTNKRNLNKLNQTLKSSTPIDKNISSFDTKTDSHISIQPFGKCVEILN